MTTTSSPPSCPPGCAGRALRRPEGRLHRPAQGADAWLRLPAYNRLAAAMDALEHTGVNDAGLCYWPDGKQYYTCLVKRDTGSSRTVPQLQELTRAQMAEDLSAMQSVAPVGEDAAAFSLDDSSPQAILAALKDETEAYFPALPDTDAQVRFVQPEMEEFLSPAFYMVPAIDNAGKM